MTYRDIEGIKELAVNEGCLCSENEPLAGYTTFGIGGKCPLFIEAAGESALSVLIRELKAKALPYYIIGKGSNLLIDDRDTDIIFIRIGKLLSGITLENDTLICKAGAALSAAAAAACEGSLCGMEFAYGIPGTVGGAVYMNAGAYGGEIKDIIIYAKAIDSEGRLCRFERDEMKLSYRHSIFCENKFVITEAAFRLNHGDKDSIAAKMKELTLQRRLKQPLEYKSAGSTFKRPTGAFAAALIEQCGLKGYSAGGAQVSEKHSGFVINKGGATFADVMAVIDHVKSVVFEKTGYILECEPEIICKKD